MTAPYLGLAQAEFDDIHEAVAEAMAYVVLPVQFFIPKPVAVDSLYGEAVAGADNWQPYGGEIHASIRLNPTDEELTKLGMIAGSAILGFIPQKHVRLWEQDSGLEWTPQRYMEVEYDGTRYNVNKLRTDKLPVGDGSTTDTIGPMFTAETKPRK